MFSFFGIHAPPGRDCSWHDTDAPIEKMKRLAVLFWFAILAMLALMGVVMAALFPLLFMIKVTFEVLGKAWGG